MIAAQEPGRRGMAKPVAVAFEHAMCSEQAQHPVKRAGVGADGCRKVACRPRCRIQRVSDAELGDDVQAARQGIAARDLQQRGNGIGRVRGGRPGTRPSAMVIGSSRCSLVPQHAAVGPCRIDDGRHQHHGTWPRWWRLGHIATSYGMRDAGRSRQPQRAGSTAYQRPEWVRESCTEFRTIHWAGA